MHFGYTSDYLFLLAQKKYQVNLKVKIEFIFLIQKSTYKNFCLKHWLQDKAFLQEFLYSLS